MRHVAIALALGILCLEVSWGSAPPATMSSSAATRSHANRILRQASAPFVPNLGQWEHPALFVRRTGPVATLVEDRGWTLHLQEPGKPAPVHERVSRRKVETETRRAVAVSMTFLDTDSRSRLVGEEELPGYSNYFLGNDENRWRTDVPHYSSVRYEGLYPGIDVRLRQQDGNLEYDLLCDPGADLFEAIVEVDGSDGLRLDPDGSLVIDTALGPIRQPRPTTWEVLADGSQRTIECDYVLLEENRFGFVAERWDGTRALVLDPGLLWSTFLGGSDRDMALGVSVDASGIVTVTGTSQSLEFPTTVGNFDPSHNHAFDIFVSRLDPSKTGSAQLIYSTFLGGRFGEAPEAIFVDDAGVVTLAGETVSDDFPVTFNAFDRTKDGHTEAFVSRLDPTKPETAQLVFSTYLGGSNVVGYSIVNDLAVDASGVITVVGQTTSEDFPVTIGAFDRTYTKPIDSFTRGDAFVSRLDPSKVESEQLIYSTFLGGGAVDAAYAVANGPGDMITVVGGTNSPEFPTSMFALDRTFGGANFDRIGDGFLTRLDPNRFHANQLVYSTFLGGTSGDTASAVSVDADGVVTVAGTTESQNFRTSTDAFDRRHNGKTDVFITRLNPEEGAKLIYSTFLGGRGADGRSWPGLETVDLSVDDGGIVTVSGQTRSANFPTTRHAELEGRNKLGDVFVTRLNPEETGNAQLLYSTFLGASNVDIPYALSVDSSGIATIAGQTLSHDFRTTPGAYDREYDGSSLFGDAFITRLDLQPAVVPYGAGLEGTGGFVPAINVPRGQHPRIGSDVEIELSALLGNAPCVIAVSLAPAETQFQGVTLYGDFLTPGASLYWGLTAISPFGVPRNQPGGGRAEFILSIPDDPALVGFRTYWQGLVLDSSSPSPIGVSHTGGLEVIFVH